MAKPTKRGGAREGSGRKKNEEKGLEKKEHYGVSLTPSAKDRIVKEHGSLTRAIEKQDPENKKS